jgi:CubicO group peptidase (beta-lactamase class C family)
MNKEGQRIAEIVRRQTPPNEFSGVIQIRKHGAVAFESAYGLANRADQIPNRIDTRFAMASGCKIFTAVAACQLVDRGLLSFDARLCDCLDIRFPHFDPKVSVHHLLTHTSGIPDYFDEQMMDDYADLWRERPMYTIRSPRDFLPMFQNEKMRFAPGERFYYSESGFITLGLIVEHLSSLSFKDYIRKNIFEPAGMTDSGYFATDQLPPRTALNYIYDKETGSWRTNIFAVPIIGAPDGGAFTTAPDMSGFWRALNERRLLNEPTTQQLLTPYVRAESEGADMYYGYGVWITRRDDHVVCYGVQGYDPGVAMRSTVFPAQSLEITMLGNTSEVLWPIYRDLLETLGLD